MSATSVPVVFVVPGTAESRESGVRSTVLMALKKHFADLPVDVYKPLLVRDLVFGTRLPCDVFVRENGIMKRLFNRGMIYCPYAEKILTQKSVREIYYQERKKTVVEQYVAGEQQEEKISIDPAVFRAYASERERYFQVERTLLIEGSDVGFCLYLLADLQYRLLLEASEKEPARIDTAVLSVPGEILIRQDDVRLYNEYLQSIRTMRHLPQEESTKVEALLVKESSKLVIKEILDDPRSGEMVKQVGNEIEQIVDLIFRKNTVLFDMLELQKYDYFTYTHSVDVAVMSVALGRAMNMDRDKLEKLGMGAMLHDIGKSVIDHDIVCKQGGLNNTEYLQIKKHVLEGVRLLRDQKDFPEESMPAVLQHHERLTGRGYPLGLSGEVVSLFGRITSIVDCYDALTTERPYKHAFTPYYSLSIMVKEKKDYDCDILTEFVEMLGNAH